MNIGEFIIKIGTQGDTKALSEAINKTEQAEKKSKRLLEYLKKLKEATSDYEKKLIKKNFAQQVELDNLKNIDKKQKELNHSMASGINTALKMTAAIGATVVALDRMGNSLLKSNQMYITFQRQTDMSIGRLNRMAGLARLSGMNLSPDQVAGDLQSLQQKIFRLGLTGEGSGIFAQLGMNPIGMSSDQFIAYLRRRTQGMSGQQKSYVLGELGLSQEWLNVLDLTNKEFQDYLTTAKDLQLTEEERKQLAKYTLQQQKNNMRWELAKQKVLIALMPAIQKIMDFTSKIALNISNSLGNEQMLRVVRDIAMLFGVIAIRAGIIKNALSFLTALKGLGAMFGIGASALAAKGAGKMIAGRAAGAAAANAFPGIGQLISIALGIWTIVDIFKLFMNKENIGKQDPLEATQETIDRYNYQNVKSNMTNNFYNNPQPAQAVIDELTTFQQKYLAEQFR